MRTAATLLPIITLALLLPLDGCYSPSLSDEPFRCAATGKACPDGYECDLNRKVCVKEGLAADAGVDLPPTDAIAVATKDGPVRVDGALVRPADDCIDKSAEPNNSAATAFKLPKTGRLVGWEVCYPGDVDHYAIDLNVNQSLAVKVEFKHDAGDLEAALVDPAGNVVLSSRTETDDEELKLNKVTNAGTHYIVVFGFGEATNGYDLDVTVDN